MYLCLCMLEICSLSCVFNTPGLQTPCLSIRCVFFVVMQQSLNYINCMIWELASKQNHVLQWKKGAMAEENKCINNHSSPAWSQYIRIIGIITFRKKGLSAGWYWAKEQTHKTCLTGPGLDHNSESNGLYSNNFVFPLFES